MFTTYARILRIPGAWAFSATGLVGRLPLSMLGLGIVLLISERTDSYAQAGAVSAAAMVAGAVGAPLQGRLTDAFGQHVVLPVAAAVFGLGLGLGLVAVHAGLLFPVVHVCAAVAGLALPQIGSMVRARWTYVADARQLPTAFALEAVLDEVVFIVGPVLVTFLATLVNPYVGLVVAGATGVAGAVGLALQRRTEPPAHRSRATGAAGATARERIDLAVLLPVVAVAIGFGLVFGATEVVTVAVAQDAGHREIAGFLLALWAFGSLSAGVWVGAHPPRVGPEVQLRIGGALLALSFVPLLLAPSLLVVGIALVLSGLMIAPSMVAATRLVEQGVPRRRLTEGMAWFTTGLAIGVAPGAAVSGWVIDHVGPHEAYGVCLVAGLVAALGGWLVRSPGPVNHPAPVGEPPSTPS